MKARLGFILSAALVGTVVTSEVASAQTWANWSLPTECSGAVTGSFGAISVTYTGSYNGVQDATQARCVAPGSLYGFASPPQDYFTPGSVYNPTPTNQSFLQFVDMVKLNEDNSAYVPITTNTLSFSQAVINPFIAIISAGNRLNRDPLTGDELPNTTVNYQFFNEFGDVVPFEILSYNPDGSPAPYWGNSLNTFNFGQEYTTLPGQEFSGVLRFTGTFTSLSFTVDANENWHGLTVGAEAIDVPEPSAFAIMIPALLGLGFVARRRKA